MDHTEIQQSYYTASAAEYDLLHGDDPAHNFALSLLAGVTSQFHISSVLDVGAGTGRAGLYLQKVSPGTSVIGIEPVAELRRQGHMKGIPEANLIPGNAQLIPFPDKSFDLVCAFGIMHHLVDPHNATLEMLRVARKAIFISDHNDYGRGSSVTRGLKQAAKETGLWDLYRLIITRGKGYRITDDDGLWYPYSIFDTHKSIKPHCSKIHFLSTSDSSPNLYRSASHVAMLGLLKASSSGTAFPQATAIGP